LMGRAKSSRRPPGGPESRRCSLRFGRIPTRNSHHPLRSDWSASAAARHVGACWWARAARTVRTSGSFQARLARRMASYSASGLS